MSLFLNGLRIHESWKDFFKQTAVKNELYKIEIELGNTTSFTPRPRKILRFATTNLLDIKLLIQGRDPYPQKNVATGRSFEVAGPKYWGDTRVNVALKNIIKLINKSCKAKEFGSSIAEVRSEISNKEFNIPAPNLAFDYWEQQGVLFLNTAFTCEVGDINQSGSHVKLWRLFFKLLIDYIAKKNHNIKYVLWGKAKKYEKLLKKMGVKTKNIYTSKHPCTNGDNGGYKNNTEFLNCSCFFDTKKTIKWVYN